MGESGRGGKVLLLMRHAKSSWEDGALADFERPLNGRGKRDAPRMGEFLRRRELLPELIFTSAARRARDTTTRVVEASGYEGEVRSTRELYEAEPEDFLEVLHAVPDSCARVMLVAHNPGLEMLLELLTGIPEALPTGALAAIQLPVASWKELHEGVRGKLLGLWSPKTLL